MTNNREERLEDVFIFLDSHVFAPFFTLHLHLKRHVKNRCDAAFCLC